MCIRDSYDVINYDLDTIANVYTTPVSNFVTTSDGQVLESGVAVQHSKNTFAGQQGCVNDGGGVFLSNGTHNLTNVTISGNTAGDEGGGVFVSKVGTGNHYYNTITDNTAGDKGGGLRNEFSAGTVKVTGSIIAGNRGPTCLLYTSPSPRDRQKSRMPSSA